MGVELELAGLLGVFALGLLGEVVIALLPELLDVGLELGPVGVVPVKGDGLDPPLSDKVGGAPWLGATLPLSFGPEELPGVLSALGVLGALGVLRVPEVPGVRVSGI